MTAYDQIFYPIFGAGCAIAVIASFLAAWRSGFVLPGIFLVAGVVSFWAGLFIGSDMGYLAWQSIPNPPEEAFSDTFPLGALLFGWLPGGVFCVVVFGFFRFARYLLSGGKPGSKPADPAEPASKSAETGNPYQAPKSQRGG